MAFFMINKNYQGSAQTEAGGGRATPSPQSRARSNKGIRAYRRKKYEPDKRQLELEFDFGISQQENTGGGK